jgi:cellulose synthase/poly-beta-1,6-N-acetylglucosamine synthase-like glycosyltransferase
MLCSIGVFQLWRRDLLIDCGGWATGYTCEDIELTFRVHERMQREGTPYRILCLPDTVGTTEGPDSVRKLVAQRERWQRVILETLWAYRYMCFNPRYRAAGMLGVPYYVLSEVLAPFFEVAAIGTLAAGVALGTLSWQLFVLVFLLIALGNATLSAGAILASDRQSRDYRLGSIIWLLLLAPLELVLYRPIMVWARLKGTGRFLRRDKGWHKFERNSRTISA